MTTQTVLLLARHADAAWRGAIRPWLEEGRNRLQRAYVIVATRGQAHGLKQRCLLEGVPLFGVEFLTPGLARKKWAALAPAGRPALGRELLLLQLRTLVARRAKAAGGDGAGPRDGQWGFWQSLQSDAERALDDFDDLLKAGFRAEDFPLAPLRDVFGELMQWADTHGYGLAPVQAARAAAAAPDRPPLAARVLVYGLGAELWGEFFNVAAFVRRCTEVTAVLPEPEFRDRAEHDEQWIDLWETLLGAEPLPLDVEEPAGTCQAVADVWRQPAASAVPAQILIGRTRRDEMRRVANEICARLQGGPGNIAVIFPRSDAAHVELARQLDARGVPFADLLENAGPPPIEVQAQRALLALFARGSRLEELLALWPLLRALGTVTLPLAAARRACDRTFDLRQTHSIAPHIGEWESEHRTSELAQVARALGDPWPDELTLAAALARFRAACDALDLDAPEAWGALDHLAAADGEPKPREVLTDALGSFLPEGTPARTGVRGGFARVTLTSRRRAEGLAWSHVFLVESNARVWPERREPGCWLTDEHRAALNGRRPYPLGLFNAEQRATLEKAGYARLVRDTTAEIIFSAALFSDDDPELRLAPNGWLERVLLANGHATGGDLEHAFTQLACSAVEPARGGPEMAAWHDIWLRRRDPGAPFDEFFFAGDPARITPAQLPARLIERGVQDPAELWFEAVLGTKRVPWTPFVRARRKALGQWAHALLAQVLAPAESQQGFGPMPAPDEVRQRLAQALAAQRELWPANAYWDSFHAELAQVCRGLVDNLHTIPAGPFVATEAWLPDAARLQVGERLVPIRGRLDLVRLDRAGWAGAEVDIVDFKTGGDQKLSAERMARSGASLQLGVYLAAARSLGIRGGRVWMIKPEPAAVRQLSFDDMAVALTKLQWLEQALTRGVYGALTRDRSDYAPAGCDWPLACTPIPHATLERKFAATFAVPAKEALDEQ